MTGVRVGSAPTSDPVARASADWLSLREPADAAARSLDLVDILVPLLPAHALVIHDLGSGTGSMRRWLSALLPQAQHWVEHDRDRELLQRTSAPTLSSSGRPVTCEARESDITRIPAEELADASLITASALLDMFTDEELSAFVQTSLAARCPSLLTLSVIGQVTFDPSDPLDDVVTAAFNDHQRRTTAHGTLLGPDAAGRAAGLLRASGATVQVRPSTWVLDHTCLDLFVAWFDGWTAAASEQRPELVRALGHYTQARVADVASGRATARIEHVDLLVLP